MKLTSLVAPLVLFLTAACAHSRIVEIKNNTVLAGTTLTLTTEWMTVRKNKFETSVNLTNNSPGPLLIWLKDITCQAGRQIGQLSTPDYENKDGVMAFRRAESKNIMFRCRFSHPPEGAYKLLIANVYTTSGRLLINNVVLEQPSK